jgi:hypothetical protein
VKLWLIAGGVCAVLGAALLVVAHDVRSWDRAVKRGDAALAARPNAARWNADTWLPADPVRGALVLDDDLALRRAVVAYLVARRTPRGLDNGIRAARVRAAAEIALAGVVGRGAPAQSAQAGNLLGVLVATGEAGPDASVTEDRARQTFAAAVRADPTSDDAKYNLELLLRRIRVVGTRTGPGTGSGNRGDSRRGAGAGLPGEGY